MNPFDAIGDRDIKSERGMMTLSSVRAKRWEIGGLSLSFDEVQRASGIPKRTLLNRLRAGWGIEEAVMTPTHRYRKSRGDSWNRRTKTSFAGA